MSVRGDRPQQTLIDLDCKRTLSLKWTPKSNVDFDDENGSISSEEEAACGSGSDQFRIRPEQEIWTEEEIWSALQALPEAEEITEIINNNQYELLQEHKNASMTAMLIASWLGNKSALESILEGGQSAKEIDINGRSALHLAAYSGNENCAKILIEHGAELSNWDYKRKATPLHCAASKGHIGCLKTLIENGADVNAGMTTRSALHYAVQSSAVDCVKELLESGANPNIYQVFSETPLHVAAALGCPEIIKLLLEYGAAVHVQCGPDKSTPLHLAAEDGDAESARLLVESGADVNATNHKLQTPLHLAALSQSSETLELLLRNGANPNIRDVDGRTPLHSAIVKVSRCYECVRLLLNSGANVNTSDAFGYTPLHLAALNEFSHCVMLLINHGGDVTARTNGGISVLTFITRRTPDVIPKYISKFDASINVNDHEIGDVDCEIKLDFRILVPAVSKGESELLLNFIEVGHREILKHPLCETFLFLKWRRIRKFFLFSLFYHTLFVLLFTGYIIGVFLKNCPPLSPRMFNPCTVATYIKVMGFALIVLNFMLMGKEIFQIAHSWFSYIKQWENWLQWLIIISVFCCVYPSKNMDIRRNVEIWQHHVAAIGIFLAWLELMMIVGRFPIFGLYVQMFTTVAINFSKFLLAYLCLLVAFSLSFGVLFTNYPAFKNLIWGFLKTLIMMSGELEFEDIFYGDYTIIYPVTAHIIFLIFVLLVTVILTNLMVGLAVSDIQGLQQSAGLDRLVRQAELVAHLESMLFSRLLRCFPRRLLAFFYRHALLLKSHYHWALYIKPNDPREERIPKDLIKSIYQIVAERKDKPRIRNKYHSQRRACNVLRLNSNNSNVTDNNRNQSNLKAQIDEIQKELLEYSKVMKGKLDNLQTQLNNSYTYKCT